MKNVFNIGTINFNLSFGGAAPVRLTSSEVPHELMAAIFADIARQSGQDKEDEAGDAAAEGTTETDLPTIDPDLAGSHETSDAEGDYNPPAAAPANAVTDITAFLNSDSRFKLRTLAAIAKNFNVGESVVKIVVDAMVDGGQVVIRRRRSDGAALIGVAPELNETTVFQFLESNPRYTMRTFDAIAKHFGAAAGAVGAVLTNAINSGSVATKRRRRDGATLYKAVAPVAAPVDTNVAATEATVTATEAAPGLTFDNLLSFVKSDRQYGLRTIKAIAKYFAVGTSAVENMVTTMKQERLVTTKTRRRDGAKLVGALV